MILRFLVLTHYQCNEQTDGWTYTSLIRVVLYVAQHGYKDELLWIYNRTSTAQIVLNINHSIMNIASAEKQ